jgi:uncharacterized integral membrane protein
MRVLWFIIGIVLTFGFLGFLVNNFETRVPVTVLSTQHVGVPLWLVVVVAMLVMLVLVGITAVAEGAAVRLENRRLRRELHKLETEINYLRTQPGSSQPSRVDGPDPESEQDSDHRPGSTQPTAPVYGAEGDDWSPDPDDDAYSGGRAV